MTPPLWQAPTVSAPVDAAVTLPGSKSVTNRALVLSALSDEPSMIRRPLHSRDTELMAAALRTLGAGIEEHDGDWRVLPAAMSGPARINVGNAGTVMRFLLPVAALAEGPVDFDGDQRSRVRPIGALVDALRNLGARVEDGSRGTLPLTVHGSGTLAGGPVEIDASASSQFVSALLLSGPRFNQGVDIRHVGEQLPSAPHIAMTVEMLRRAGAQVEAEPERWRVSPGALRGLNVVVEPDLSNAAPFLAAAMVTGGRVTVPDWPVYTTQPGDALRELFTAMGGSCTLDRNGLTITGSDTLHGIDVDMHDIGELAPVVAAVASLADSPSQLRGIGHLRGHETDRLAALAKELTGLGGEVRETEDGLRIEPRWLHGGVFATYEDHRLAMAAAVLGLRVPGVQVENVATTAKTMPDFVGLWEGMLRSRR